MSNSTLSVYCKKTLAEHAVFIRANISSLVSGAVDFATFTLFVEYLGLSTPYAVIMSMMCGAIVYLGIADMWAFRTRLQGTPFIHESERFVLVWIGCVALNYLGTVLLSQYIPSPVARIAVSFIVGFTWSFPLFSSYVFTRNHRNT